MNIFHSPLTPFMHQPYEPEWAQRRHARRMFWVTVAGIVMAVGIAAGAVVEWVG